MSRRHRWASAASAIALLATYGVVGSHNAQAARGASIAGFTALTQAHGDEAGPAEPLLVERYVPGEEVAVEGLLRGGALEILAVFDKPDPLEGPFFEETLYVTPSRLPRATLDAIDVSAVVDPELRVRGVDGTGHENAPGWGCRLYPLERSVRSAKLLTPSAANTACGSTTRWEPPPF